MSESQDPQTSSDNNIQPTPQAEHGDAVTEPVSPKLSRTKPLPDWKPLGSIRDYFTEQMRQDSIYKY